MLDYQSSLVARWIVGHELSLPGTDTRWRYRWSWTVPSIVVLPYRHNLHGPETWTRITLSTLDGNVLLTENMSALNDRRLTLKSYALAIQMQGRRLRKYWGYGPPKFEVGGRTMHPNSEFDLHVIQNVIVM